jgi:uncharacterized membrane protein YcaP (DUF421 family)
MDIVVRAAVAYVFIVFLLRIMGRRELSALGPADLVLLVVMGDLIQNGVTQSDYSVTGMCLAVSTFAILTAATSFVTFKFPRAQRVIEGTPLILIENGKPIDDNLRSQRLNLDDVAEEARSHGLADLEDIRWCVLEANGMMSFIKRSE